MSQAWDRVRRRHDLVDEVLADVRRSGPSAVASWRGRIDRDYADDDLSGFLRDVQRRWYRTFQARLDAVLETATEPVEQAVARLWRSTNGIHPSARLLLDAYADHPVVSRTEEHNRRLLLAATGVDLGRAPQAVPSERSRRVPRLRPWRRGGRRRPAPARTPVCPRAGALGAG